MKIGILKPDGEVITFESDFWEFSQNKFKDYDVVLLFFSKEKDEKTQNEFSAQNEKTQTIEDEEIKNVENEKAQKPSKQGIISLEEKEITEDLYSVVTPETVESLRNTYRVVFDNSSNVNEMEEYVVSTNSYQISRPGSIDNSVRDLVEKESKIIREGMKIRILKPPMIVVKEDSFYITEVLGLFK
uniref:Uncharacterized protein n=1 Tax=Dictyoglomus turgidum TaxID=513050 RepID=A0A7C3SMK4_9BACT